MVWTERWDCLFRGAGWFVVLLTGLLVASLGLWEYGVHVQDSARLPWMLLALFLSSWTAFLGLAGLALLTMWLVVRASAVCR